MKKLLLSSVVLFVFSAALLVFQLSCRKDSNANPGNNNSPSQIGKLIYIADDQLYVANYDGSGNQKVPIAMPNNFKFGDTNLSVSPDGKRIFFSLVEIRNDSEEPEYLYSCNIDGTNLAKISNVPANIKGISAF